MPPIRTTRPTPSASIPSTGGSPTTGRSSIADRAGDRVRVLVTGAAGWIGARLSARLAADGHAVFALVRPGGDPWRLREIEPRPALIEGDLGDPARVRQVFQEVRPERCFHCAWYAVPGEYWHSLRNLDALQDSLRLAQLAGESGCSRFVGVGTCAEYDVRLGMLRETDPTAPRSLYPASKLAFQLVLDQLAGAMRTSWVRLFYLYGPKEDRRRLVPSIVSGLRRGEPVTVSSGRVRDFLHVGDVASAIATVAARELDGITNIGSGEPVTVQDLAVRLGRLCGRPELIRVVDRPHAVSDPPFVCADAGRLRSAGWAPAYNLEAGLADTVRWWRDHPERG